MERKLTEDRSIRRLQIHPNIACATGCPGAAPRDDWLTTCSDKSSGGKFIAIVSAGSKPRSILLEMEHIEIQMAILSFILVNSGVVHDVRLPSTS